MTTPTTINPEAVEIAKDIRSAIQNLNELAQDAFDMGVHVHYDVRRARYNEPGNPTIFSNVSLGI